MDNFYDHDKAEELVYNWSKIMDNPDRPFASDSFVTPAALMNLDAVDIKKYDKGRAVKAMVVDVDGARKEAIMGVVGALKLSDLPPVRKDQATPRRAQFLRAHASVVGYQSAAFKDSIPVIASVMYKLSLAFAEGSMEPWIPDDFSDVFGYGLTGTCRYFTTGHTPSTIHTAFAKHVDPHGTLKNLLNDRLAHCLDNCVIYRAFVNNSFIAKDPATFRDGDIVEMGFAAVGFQMASKGGKDRYTCKLALRTLTLLDTTASTTAGMARNAQRLLAQNVKPTNNKRSGSEHEEDEDISQARRRITCMRITSVKAAGEDVTMTER